MTMTNDTERMSSFLRRLTTRALDVVDQTCDLILSTQGGEASTPVQILKGLCTAEKAARAARRRKR